MNEETNVVMTDDELFFDPADFEETEETGDHTEETETEEVQQEAEADTETAEPADKAAEQEPAAEPELFELNHMGNVSKHTREETIALAQKGQDYDRIRQQRDDLQQFRSQNEEVISDLGRIAQQFGMEPAALLASMESNLLRQQGKTQAEADAIIRANKADRQLQAQQQARQQQENLQRRQQEDMREFIRRYPNMDYKTIPASVWEAVKGGETLVNAYSRHEMQQLKAENQRLQQQIAAQTQNTKNKQTSLGSMKSGASTPKIDAFMEGFERG